MEFDTHQHSVTLDLVSLQEQEHFTFHHLTPTHHFSTRNTNLLNRTHAIRKMHMAAQVRHVQRGTHSIHPFCGIHTLHCSLTRGWGRSKQRMQGRVNYWWITDEFRRGRSSCSSTALSKIINSSWRCRTSEDKPCSTEITLAQMCNTKHKNHPKTAPNSLGTALIHDLGINLAGNRGESLVTGTPTLCRNPCK